MSYVFSIEEFSTFDGPGVRTTVFLKGCPLRCEWCHNPEGQRAESEWVKSPNGCLHCGLCERFGVKRADGTIMLTQASAAICPRNLVRLSGEDYTPEELCAKLMKNAEILKSMGGGVTFSGGEPLLDHKFLIKCLDALGCRVHRALQTSGYAAPRVFAEVLKRVEYVLYDIKLIDGAAFRRYCGADNAEILDNYRTLARSGVPFVTRVPLIPGVTDTTENLTAIAKLLRENGADYVETLPYNKMAGSKYALVGREYKPSFDGEKPINTGEEIFARYGIKAVKM